MTRPGIPLRSLAGLGIGSALAVAVLSGVPRMAHGQVLICARHTLSRDDANRLKVAASAVVPKSAHVWVEGACVNSGRALGFVETQKVVTAEGVQQWWTMQCRRKSKSWQCDEPTFKQFFATRLDVAGKSRPVELSFDQAPSLVHVRMLASRAIEVYADPDSRLPECGSKNPKESDQLRNWGHYNPLPTNNDVIHLSVSQDSVEFDDFAVRIDFRSSADTSSFEAECWGLYIIVT
jgi:hypothetical protein